MFSLQSPFLSRSELLDTPSPDLCNLFLAIHSCSDTAGLRDELPRYDMNGDSVFACSRNGRFIFKQLCYARVNVFQSHHNQTLSTLTAPSAHHLHVEPKTQQNRTHTAGMVIIQSAERQSTPLSSTSAERHSVGEMMPLNQPDCCHYLGLQAHKLYQRDVYRVVLSSPGDVMKSILSLIMFILQIKNRIMCMEGEGRACFESRLILKRIHFTLPWVPR